MNIACRKVSADRFQGTCVRPFWLTDAQFLKQTMLYHRGWFKGQEYLLGYACCALTNWVMNGASSVLIDLLTYWLINRWKTVMSLVLREVKETGWYGRRRRRRSTPTQFFLNSFLYCFSNTSWRRKRSGGWRAHKARKSTKITISASRGTARSGGLLDKMGLLKSTLTTLSWPNSSFCLILPVPYPRMLPPLLQILLSSRTLSLVSAASV